MEFTQKETGCVFDSMWWPPLFSNIHIYHVKGCPTDSMRWQSSFRVHVLITCDSNRSLWHRKLKNVLNTEKCSCWVRNKRPTGPYGHLRIRDCTLTSCQKGSYLHVNRPIIVQININNGRKSCIITPTYNSNQCTLVKIIKVIHNSDPLPSCSLVLSYSPSQTTCQKLNYINYIKCISNKYSLFKKSYNIRCKLKSVYSLR